MESDINTLIGGLIGFLSSLGIQIATRLMNRWGKLNFYYRINSQFLPYWGFSKIEGKISFALPLELEIRNSSNTTRVVRDISLALWKNGSLVRRMHQTEGVINEHKHNGEIQYRDSFALGDENSSYSCVVLPKSIKKENYLFTSFQNASNLTEASFDEIHISYYDEHDKLHETSLMFFEGNWAERQLQFQETWSKAEL